MVTAAGTAWRVAATAYNVWPHGDVVIDSAVAETIASRGQILVPFVDVRYYPIDRFGFGYPMDQHPPLWPLLGAALVTAVGDGYVALKIVSLVVGASLAPLMFFAFRRALGSGAALFGSALVAASYPLVDFSGNGSLWVLLAAWYLAAVWLVARPGGLSPRRSALLGLVIGLAYLTNYPAITLPIALALSHIVVWRRRRLEWAPLVALAIVAGLALATVLPWLIYNATTFGNPLWSQPLERSVMGGGSKQVEYVIVGEEVIKRNTGGGQSSWSAIRERLIDVYGNVGFLARQLLVLAPTVALLFVAGVAWWAICLVVAARHRDRSLPTSAVDSSEEVRAMAPVVTLALVHLALILLWPTTKFRYLVPLLPLVFGVASWFLWQIRPLGQRNVIAAISLGACLFTNVWTFRSIPSHTYYYDGGLVADNFGGQGETAFVDETRRLRAAADAMLGRGPGVILGDHILSYFTRQPLVVSSTAYPPEVLRHLLAKYRVRYVVADRGNARAYASFSPRELWSDDRFVLLEIANR